MIEYLKLKSLIYFRLFRDFPFVLQLLFVVLLPLVLYGVYRIETGTNYKTIIVIVSIQVVITYTAQHIKPQERILLQSLHISLWKVKLLRIVLVSLIFFTLNPLIAGIGTLIAIIIGLLLLSGSSSASYFSALPVFYKKSSYRWISSYRRGVMWAILVLLFFQIMGYVHTNENMVIVSTAAIVCIPCLWAFLSDDSRKFLLYYKNPAWLLRSKVYENIFNTAVLVLITLPIVILSAVGGSFNAVLVIVVCVYLNLLIDGVYYAGYPTSIIGVVGLMVLTAVLFALYYQFPLYVVCITGALILSAVYYWAYARMKSIFYEHN